MILVGTSGWHYDDWVGPVYPPALRQNPTAWFEAYARRFPTVEINSTFYRLPQPPVVAGWVAKARDLGGPFEFSAKVPEEATHDALVAGDAARAVAVVRAFRRIVVDPLAEAGLFGAALVQLSPHFHAEGDALVRLDAVLAALAGVPAAVEFRHASWAPDGVLPREARTLLRARNVALVAVDGPGFPVLLEPTADAAYVRFHGRRPDAWFRPGRADEDLPARYDYAYKPEELAPWATTVRGLGERHATVRVYFNNHVRGQAFENAKTLAEMLDLLPPVRRGGQRGLDEFAQNHRETGANRPR